MLSKEKKKKKKKKKKKPLKKLIFFQAVYINTLIKTETSYLISLNFVFLYETIPLKKKKKIWPLVSLVSNKFPCCF